MIENSDTPHTITRTRYTLTITLTATFSIMLNQSLMNKQSRIFMMYKLIITLSSGIETNTIC